MNIRGLIQSILSVGLAVLTLTACEPRELCYDHTHGIQAPVQVTFDWQKAPAAQPSGMTVLFYSLDNPSADPIRYDLQGMEGGTVQLPFGRYQAVAYNYDTETILYRGWSLPETLEAYTRSSSLEEGTRFAPSRSPMPRAISTETQPVILEPDMLWCAVSDPLTVSSAADQQTVVLQPTPRFREITITIHNVPNLQYTSQFGGALSGLAASTWMASGQASETLATEAFIVSILDATTLQMHMRILGHCPRISEGVVNKHLLTIYAILADESKWYYSQDITKPLHDALSSSDDVHIYIELDGLPIPKPIVNGSGFQPVIDGWQSIEIYLGM